MESLQLINSTIEWERIAEYEEEKRKNHRSEPYVNYLATPQRRGKKQKSLFARVFQHRKESWGTVDFVIVLNQS